MPATVSKSCGWVEFRHYQRLPRLTINYILYDLVLVGYKQPNKQVCSHAHSSLKSRLLSLDRVDWGINIHEGWEKRGLHAHYYYYSQVEA